MLQFNPEFVEDSSDAGSMLSSSIVSSDPDTENSSEKEEGKTDKPNVEPYVERKLTFSQKYNGPLVFG